MTLPGDTDNAAVEEAAAGSEGAAEGQEQPQERVSPWAEKMAKLRADLGVDDAASVDEPEDLEEVDEPGAGAENPDEPGDPDGAGVDEPEGDEDAVVLTFPGRTEEDEPVELALTREQIEAMGLDAEQVLERNRQLNNGYARRAALQAERAELDRDRQEFEGILRSLKDEPAAFVVEHVAPEMREQLVEELLVTLDAKTFQKVVDRVDRWARDPRDRELEGTRRENRRLRARDEAERAEGAQDDVRQNVMQVRDAIQDLIPDDMPEERAKSFFRLAVTAMQDHARRNELTLLEPAKVPEVLASLGVLEGFGLSADAQGAGPSRANGAGSAAAKSAPDEKRPAGQEGGVRSRMDRRRKAVTTPAGAASSAAAGFRKVKGERHESRMDRLYKTLGLQRKRS